MLGALAVRAGVVGVWQYLGAVDRRPPAAAAAARRARAGGRRRVPPARRAARGARRRPRSGAGGRRRAIRSCSAPGGARRRRRAAAPAPRGRRRRRRRRSLPPGPPPPPPIPLKFIGLVERRQRRDAVAVLSDGKGLVVHGREGDIIDGRYRILTIGAESIEIAYADGRGRQTMRLTGQ